jgi:SMODS-associating 2TM, beta-strand rich effector domain
MHPYSIDIEERRVVLFAMVVLSILAALALPKVAAAASWVVPWWLDVPSVWGFFGGCYWLVDRIAWKMISRIPDLNGTWHGHVSSSFDQHATEHKVTVRIQQTWTRLGVALEGESSRSYSVMGAVLISGPQGPELSYEYVNEPRSDAAAGLHAHRGFVRAGIRGDVLRGDYYTGRDRESNGVLLIRRQAA